VVQLHICLPFCAAASPTSSALSIAQKDSYDLLDDCVTRAQETYAVVALLQAALVETVATADGFKALRTVVTFHRSFLFCDRNKIASVNAVQHILTKPPTSRHQLNAYDN